MRYDYECAACDRMEEVIKSLHHLDEPELCESCSQPMLRVISAVQISTSNCQFEAHHNWAFGKTVNSKNELKECQRRLQGETGKEIVEVGNDKMGWVKKPRKKYTVDGYALD